MNDLEPPRAPKPSYTAVHKSRWEKEKIAAGDDHAFDHPEDPNYLGNWQLGETVGKGASGRVKIARHKATGELAAVKILPKGEIEKQRTSVEREIVMMKLMEHPNVLKLHDVWEGETDLFLIFEYIKGGELFDYIVNHGRLQPVEAVGWFKQIISGLAYTHRLGVCHRDLKPENILISSVKPPVLKIADWGMAAFTPPSFSLHTSCGSPHYASPQIVNGEPYDGAASDIWSCGVILFALLTGRLPFDDRNVKVLLGRVKSGRYEIPPFVLEEGQDLIRRMLVVNVEDRITMSELLAHPFMLIDTPLVPFHSPPSISDLARPVPNDVVYSGDIDSDTMHSLKIIWRGNADDDELRDELLSPKINLAKAFYWLLERYRERRLERYGMDDDLDCGFLERVVGGQGGAKPYQLVMPAPKHVETIPMLPLPQDVLPSTPPALSSMSSTLAAFEMVGRENLQEHSNSPTKKNRFSYSKPKGPRQPSTASKTLSIVAKPTPPPPSNGLGIASPRLDIDELAERVHAVLGNSNKQPKAQPLDYVAPRALNPLPPPPPPTESDAKRKKHTTISFDTADKENLRTTAIPQVSATHASHTSRQADIRSGRQRAGTIHGYGEEAPSFSPLPTRPPPRRRISMTEKKVKQRPSALGLESSPRKVTQPATPIVRAAPPTPKTKTSAPSTPSTAASFSMPVTGFFANLFNWKPQSYTLRSFEDISVARAEVERLLTKNRVVIVSKEAEDLWKCWAQSHEGPNGQTLLKEVNFRVEFASLYDVGSPILGGKGLSAPYSGYLARVTLIQEKGALSTFKRIHYDVKSEWRLDSLAAVTPLSPVFTPSVLHV